MHNIRKCCVKDKVDILNKFFTKNYFILRSEEQKSIIVAKFA
jgi:hypothetical protein